MKKIEYSFKLKDETLDFSVDITRHSQKSEGQGVEWTKLSYHQCHQCPLSEKDHPNCPVAMDVKEIVSGFSKLLSYDTADIVVKTEERDYHKECDIQTGLKALLGLVMATSACPILSTFRGMAQFHLPFATIDETVVRTVSFFLLKKYFDAEDNEEHTVTSDLSELVDLYKTLGEVNASFIKRVRAAVEYDANLNAILNLHADSTILTQDLKELLEELRPLLETYGKISVKKAS